MREVDRRIVVGLALTTLVTATLAGAVATSAAITIELSDGDACETGGSSDVVTTATPENVTSLAGNVTRCIAGDDDPGEAAGEAPSGAG